MRAVLFDLDGTLLPLRFEDFLPRYLGLLDQRFGSMIPGFVGSLMAATQHMMQSDDGRTNEEVFWSVFGPRLPRPREELTPVFMEFYRRDFPALGADIAREPAARAVVEGCRALGLRVALATNPVFPLVALEERARWAGLEPAQFDLITSLERMRSCKPRPSYFAQTARELGVAPADCLMVGNDVGQDLAPAAAVGMRTCLVENGFQVAADGFTPDHRAALPDVLDVVRAFAA